MSRPRTLVVGWFSWPDRKATFGDVQAMEVVTKWLFDEKFDYDVAGHESNGVKGLSIDRVKPSNYDSFIFVCGPWGRKSDLLERFSSCFRIGIDLSVSI